LANSPIDDLTNTPPPFVVGDSWTLLLVVGGIALVFVGYLVVDHFISRRRTKRFLRKRPPL